MAIDIHPVEFPIRVIRGTAYTDVWTFVTQDFTANTFKMQIRNRRNGGAILATLVDGANLILAYAGAALISAHVSSGRLDTGIYSQINPNTGLLFKPDDYIELSRITVALDLNTISVPFPEKVDDDIVFYYDLFRKPLSDPASFALLYGTFTIQAGVTVP